MVLFLLQDYRAGQSLELVALFGRDVLCGEDDDGNPVVTMTEAHQLGPAEVISMGVVSPLFDAICAGCHGSISGREIDVEVTPDVLTGASQSLSLGDAPTDLSP